RSPSLSVRSMKSSRSMAISLPNFGSICTCATTKCAPRSSPSRSLMDSGSTKRVTSSVMSWFSPRACPVIFLGAAERRRRAVTNAARIRYCIAVTLIVGQPIALCRLSGVVGVYGRPRAWRATKGDRLSLPLQRDDGLRLGGAAFADRADLFRCLELDADAVELDSERMRDPFADRAAVVLQLRALEDDGGIDVDDRVAELERKLFRVAEEDERIASFPARVGIGEMHTDIAEGGGAENGIGDGVGEDVGVGVSGESEFAGDGDAAENERAAGLDAVHVP